MYTRKHLFTKLTYKLIPKRKYTLSIINRENYEPAFLSLTISKFSVLKG